MKPLTTQIFDPLGDIKGKRRFPDAFLTRVRDRYQFRDVIYHFHNSGIDLNFAEVGNGFPPKGCHIGNDEGYFAVFYQNEQTPEIKKMIREWRKYFNRQPENLITRSL